MYIENLKNMTYIIHNGKKYVLFFGYKAPFSNMYNKEFEFQKRRTTVCL